MMTHQAKPCLRTATLVAFLLVICTPLLYANNLYVCKDGPSSGALNGDIFSFHVTGGHLPSAGVGVSVLVGHCTFVATGPNLEYIVTEEPHHGYPPSVLTNVFTTPPNALINWEFPLRSAVVKVYTGNTYVHFVNSLKTEESGRWTGGGSIITLAGERITHGLELHCNPSRTPNNLEINFGGNRFHLKTLTSATCYIDPAGVPVIYGTGTGLYNGASGYTVHFTFSDAGEPGTKDFASYLITGPNGATILSASGYLRHGNQVYHPH